MSKHTPEPWRVVYGHDTHKVKRDRQGGILGDVVVPFEDYLHIIECVNACNGINPEAISDLLEAAKFALNYISNTEGEFGIILDTGNALRDAIAKAEGD